MAFLYMDCLLYVCWWKADEKELRGISFSTQTWKTNEKRVQIIQGIEIPLFFSHSKQVRTDNIRDTHYREFAVAEPHHPASPVCSSTPAAHPPGNDPTGPPGETSQLPEY